MTIIKNKKIHILIAILVIVATIVSLYPAVSRALQTIRSHSYIYNYSTPKHLVLSDVSYLPPANAVPVLMYHGIINSGPLGENTSRSVFINQMEMLKQQGYETITVKEYDKFREGTFVLPSKPIILTFDDGRKDSYFTVDKIFEELGFKGTIFIATAKANADDPFYLSWKELSKLQVSGRWEIEAHGQHSHSLVSIDDTGTQGRYLTSRIYEPGKGLESIEDFNIRVRNDFAYGIEDLKNNLRINSRYFAIPLDDYGVSPVSNYNESADYNNELTRQYFKLAFRQAIQKNNIAIESFYNYADSSQYNLKRLEVKNSSSENLLKMLQIFSPSKPSMVFSGNKDINLALEKTQVLYGSIDINEGMILSSSEVSPSGRVLLGDESWKNYRVNASVSRDTGRSFSMFVYYEDEKNYINLIWSEESLKITESIKGISTDIATYYPWTKKDEVEIMVQIIDGRITAVFGDVELANSLPVKLLRGSVGFGVWDPAGASSTIKSLEIVSLN